MRHRDRSARLLALCCLGALGAAQAAPPDPARATIAADDGWAAQPTADLPLGTTGGAAASAARDHVVRDRNALVAALAWPDATPKIVRIAGTIDANVDAGGRPLSCEDYARPDPETDELYTREAYVAAYDPAVWGRTAPAGPQERARVASAAAQQARVRIRVPANTTIIGVGADARLRGAWIDIRPQSTNGNQPMNVIVRNLTFEDSFDCFPAWDPTDGAQGNWNALYDSISVRNATHVWVDRNRFRNVTTRDETLPTYFGRLYQVHDGHLDVTNVSDFVTVSWNHFADHDKAMLIGSSDGASADRGRLRVTLHHNWFQNLGQRVPRVRFGQVHAYNNLYTVDTPVALQRYGYSWGVGVESALRAEANHFQLPPALPDSAVIDRFNGETMYAEGNLRDGRAFDPVAAHNAAHEVPIANEARWHPPLHGRIDPAWAVPARVRMGAGPRATLPPR